MSKLQKKIQNDEENDQSIQIQQKPILMRKETIQDNKTNIQIQKQFFYDSDSDSEEDELGFKSCFKSIKNRFANNRIKSQEFKDAIDDLSHSAKGKTFKK